MTNPVANFSGLSSGVQWNDIVDSILGAEKARLVTPVRTRIDRQTAQREAWTTFQKLVDTLNDKSRNIRVAGFGGFLASAPTSPTTSRTLLGASASPLAQAGRYDVEVVQLAQGAKVGGNAVADRTVALGFSGDFTLNGATITVGADDTLNTVRDRINAANSGGTPTGVSATIISDGAQGGRLVLTRTATGAEGVQITDGTGGLARELGFVDSRTRQISSTTEAIASALGLQTSPPPATLRVGNQTITVDLSVDSLAAIMSKINAAGGQASVRTEPFGDESRYRLMVDGNVQAVDGDANSQAVLEALGFAAGGFGDVQQVVRTGAFTDAGGNTATTATQLAGLQFDGADAGLAVGDAINIRGLRGDGTEVTIGIKIDPGETVQDLLDKINDATAGFGSGGRAATATLGPDGRIRLMDGTGGASRLSMSMDIVRADGSTGSLGTAATETAGRSRELQRGQDAIIRVDGAEMTRSSNTITDAITGVTLSLAAAEVGTTIPVDITRDVDGAVKAAQELTDAYNAVRTFFDEQRVLDAPLYGNSSLRGVVDTFTFALRTEVDDNTEFGRAPLAGMSLSRTGALTLNTSRFRTALENKPAEIEALFGFSGIGGAFVVATDNATRFGTGAVSSQIKSIDESQVTLRRRETDAEVRLEARRQQLVAQFTRMESALSRLNSQGTALSGLMSSLQNSGR